MKIQTIKEGNLIANLYLNKDGGYYYRIYLGKQIRSQLLSQSYVYFYSKDQCVEKMKIDLKTLLNIDKDLFDFSKLERM